MVYKLEQEIALWDPTAAEDVTTDPFKTLFVGRINYYTSESKIRREFETYGPIKQIKLVHDKETGKPRGYCFIEFEHERDMHCKYIVGNLKRPLLFLVQRQLLCINTTSLTRRWRHLQVHASFENFSCFLPMVKKNLKRINEMA